MLAGLLKFAASALNLKSQAMRDYGGAIQPVFSSGHSRNRSAGSPKPAGSKLGVTP